MGDINIDILNKRIQMLSQRLQKSNREQDIEVKKNMIREECKRYIQFIKQLEKNKDNIDLLINILMEAEEILVNEYAEENLTQDRIMRILENRIVSRYIMNYDKARFINPKALATITTSKGEKFKATTFHKRDEEPVIYEDKKVRIQKLGLLYFKHTTGLAEYIPKYRITKGDKSYEVYSSIIISEMQEDELYKEAVLEVLLGDNNLNFSNCSGYIGTIEETNKTNKNLYKINDKYCLYADGTEATAAYEYERMMKILEQRKKAKTNEARFSKMSEETRDL